MPLISLTAQARQALCAIHEKSRRVNAGHGRSHTEVLLELARAHATEITDLFRHQNSHYLKETGDLLVLCLEILIEAGADADDILARCYARYHAKLDRLLADSPKGGV